MNKLVLQEIAKGLLTQIPVVNKFLPRHRAGGGTQSAEYCYGVWMKHLTFLLNNGCSEVPQHVAELGPGNSLGVGYAMLLAGAQKYSAFDAVRLANDAERSASMFEELHTLFSQKASRPVKGWPDFDHLLDQDLFLSSYFTEQKLALLLQSQRVSELRQQAATSMLAEQHESIAYIAPWSYTDKTQSDSMDLVYSHSVMEYMDDLDACYQSQWKWLKPGGFISHQIDLTGHSLSTSWDGFRGYSERTWQLMQGSRPVSLNRQPSSAHVEAIEKAGFKVTLKLLRDAKPETIPAKRWADLSELDRCTSGLFIQAQKQA